MSATRELTLADAVDMIDDLRRQVRELREQLATEVRTQRITVVDEVGDEHVHIYAKRDMAQIQLTSSAVDDATVSLFAGPTGCMGSDVWAIVSTAIGDGAITAVRGVERMDDGHTKEVAETF